MSLSAPTTHVSRSAPRPRSAPLQKWYSDDRTVTEIGVDEVGRGPLFGRVYTAAVMLPKPPIPDPDPGTSSDFGSSFDFALMKDSKKFHSPKKLLEAEAYIKAHALAWHVTFESETAIDSVNILQATQASMHASVAGVLAQLDDPKSTISVTGNSVLLLIDGNYFVPMVRVNRRRQMFEGVSHVCVEGGDNAYASIAAASILAKAARDRYIAEMCAAHPFLVHRYGIDSNKGYGAKQHMDGILEHGISPWHRRTFAPCKYHLDRISVADDTDNSV